MENQVTAIVLAAGRGTRIGANGHNKVVFEIGDKPMVRHTVDNLIKAGIQQIIAVVGYQADSVRRALGNDVEYAIQQEALGTADATKSALPIISSETDLVIVASGDDSAFYPPELYQKMCNTLLDNNADIVMLTLVKDDPTGLGRIVRDDFGNVARIVEEKVASDTEKQINEINSSMYCFKKDVLINLIPHITQNEVSQEYYLTDIIELANSEGKKVFPLVLENENNWQGVNTKEDLAKAQEKYTQIQKTTSD